MFLGKLYSLCLILEIVCQIFALVELPHVEDNNILATNSVVQEVTNNLFSTLKLKNVKEKPRLRQYSVVHNYLASVTLQDSANLEEIAELTKVDKEKINNETWYFMTAINEALNDDKIEVELSDEDVLRHIELFLNKLESYKANHKLNNSNLDINDELLKYFITEDNIGEYNYTQENIDSPETSDNETLNESEFWDGFEPSGRRIYKGTRTKIKYFPFMASIQIFNNFQCSGSIISSDLIISAASCLQLAYNNRFFRENPTFLSVRIGSTYYNGAGELIAVSEVYFHPGYDPKNLRNNICIMRLVRHIRFRRRDKKIKKIDFDRHASALPMTTNGITVLGWGARQSNNIIHEPRLSYAVLDVYDLRECQDIYSREYVTKKNFCAGFVSRGGGACNRDVGGPGVANGLLTGIISFGAPMCGTVDAPTVFTKVGFYTDWIEEIMEQVVPVSRKRTTLKPRYPAYYSVFHTLPPKTTYKIEPPTGKLKPQPINEIDTLRILRDRDLFKEFLKTMFHSNEIENYEDLLKDEEQSMKHEAIKPTDIKNTNKPVYFESVTEMGSVDFDSSKELESSVAIGDSTIEIEERVTKDVAEKSDDLENELEERIVKLIDKINIKDFVEEAAGEPNGKVLTSKELLNLVHTLKDDKLKMNNDSILTLLYLSDSEKQDSFGAVGAGKIQDTDIVQMPFKDMTLRNNATKYLHDNILVKLLSDAFRAEFGNITMF